MANEIDQILADGTEDTHPIDQMVGEQSSEVKQSMYAASRGDSPDKYAHVMRIAKEAGLPTDVVARNTDQVERNNMFSPDRIDKMIDSNPGLSKWLANKDHATIGKDELDALAAIENTTSEFGVMDQAYNSLKSGVAGVYSSIAKVPALAYDIAAYPQNLAYEAMGSSKRVTSPDWLRNNVLADRYAKAQAEFAGKAPDLNTNVAESLSNGDFSQAGKGLFLQVVQSAPNQLALLASALSGVGTVGLATAGVMSAAGSNAENLDQGIDPLSGVPNAVLKGSIESAFESLGTFGVLKSWEHAIAKQYGKDASMQVIKDFSKTLIYGMAGEANEEAMTSIAQDMTDYITGVNPDALKGIGERAVNAGLVGAASSAGMTAPSAVTSGKVRQAQITKDNYIKVNEQINNTKLNTRSPESKSILVDNITDGKVMQDVYFSVEGWDQYFQRNNLAPATIAQQMGILEQYNLAKESGTDLKIKYSQFQDGLGNTEHYNGLADDVRFSPDALSVNEANAQSKVAREELSAADAETTGGKKKRIPIESLNTQGMTDVQLSESLVTQARAQRFIDYSERRIADPNNGMSPEESTYMTSQVQRVKEIFPTLQYTPSNTEAKKRRTESIREVRKDIESQLLAAGAFKDETKFAPEIFAAALGSLADTEGTTASEILKRFPLTIRAGTKVATGEGVLNQAKPEVSAKLNELLPRTGNIAVDDAARDELSKNPKKWAEYLQELDKLGTRSERAKAMGFNPDRIWYHGSRAPVQFRNFDLNIADQALGENYAGRGVYVSESGKVASNFTSSGIGKSGPVYILNARGDISYVPNIEESNSIDESANQSFDHVPGLGGVKNAVIRDPKDLRSIFAAFDPRFAESSQLLAQNGGSEIRGQIQIGNREGNTFQSIISLFEAKDRSTFMHESGHYLFNVMGALAESEGASQRIKDDYSELLKWAGVESQGPLTEEQQERIARGWEAYLMEGRAPTKKLAEAFDSFKTWLSAIYKTLSGIEKVAGFKINLTPEVRSVFDRMLMSEQEIEDANKRLNYQPLFALAGMNDKTSAKYINALADARIAADSTLRAKLMETELRKQKREYRELMDVYREDATATANALPIYNAHSILTKNVLADGSPRPEGSLEFKISRQDVVAQYGADVAAKFPRGTLSKEGVPLELAAGTLNFGSAKELVDALSSFTPKSQYVEAQAEARIQETYPDLLQSPVISEEAVRAAHDENRDAVYRMEMDYLENEAPGVVKDALRRITKTPSDQIMKAQAAKIIGDQRIADIKPLLYERAEAKNNALAGERLIKGDIQGALEAKRKAALNNYLYKASVDAKAEVAESASDLRKLFKKDDDIAKTRDVDMVDAARAILNAYGLAPDSKSYDDPMDYLKKIEKYDADTHASVLAIVEQALVGVDDYNNISFSKFQDVALAVDGLWAFARESRQADIDGKKMEIDEIVEDLVLRTDELANGKELPGYKKAITDKEKRGIGMLGAIGMYRKVEHWGYSFDLGNLNGTMTKLIRGVIDGQTKYELARREVHTELNEISKILVNDPKAIPANEIGYEFKDKAELLHAIAHTGNESNFQKLLLGRKWGERSEDGTLDKTRWNNMIERMHADGTLTKVDYDVVQKLWDIAEKIKPAAQRAHKKMKGYYFNEITANEVVTPFGTYAGGYVPALVDSNMSQDAKIKQTKEQMESFNTTYMLPTTGSGFTKSRVDQYSAPLVLDLNRITSHFDKVLRFTHIEPAVKDMTKVVTNSKFVEGMARVDQTVITDMVTPWLQRVATQTVSKPSDSAGGRLLDKGARYLQSNSSLNLMAMNVPNWIQNQTGLAQVMTRVGPRHMLAAGNDYKKGPIAFSEEIQNKSDYMRARVGRTAKEISSTYEDILLNPTKFEKFQDASAEFAFFGEKISNGIGELIAWNAAYRQHMAQGNSESESTKFADSTVRQTLGDASPTGSTIIGSGNAFQKLFTMLSGFFYNSGNLLMTEYQIAKEMGFTSKAGSKRMAVAYSVVIMAPAILSNLIARAFSGKGLDEDDDGDYLDEAFDILFMSQIKFATAMLPGGALLNAFYNRFNDKPYDDRVSLSPAFSTVESIYDNVGVIGKAVKGDDLNSRDIRSALTAVGFATGLPAVMVAKPLGYLSDVNSGKANPTGPIDYSRGLVTGKPGK